MSYSNRELVEYFVSYKLTQKNYSIDNFQQDKASEHSEHSEEGEAEAGGAGAHANGSVSSRRFLVRREPHEDPGLEAVKEALRLSANEFEFRYQRAFSDLSSQLHITPATAYQSFESVMDEVFRDGVNWGRVVGLFAFGGALCVECMEKEMNELVDHIVDWMTVYLDNHIQPWIQSQGGWLRAPPLNSTKAVWLVLVLLVLEDVFRMGTAGVLRKPRTASQRSLATTRLPRAAGHRRASGTGYWWAWHWSQECCLASLLRRDTSEAVGGGERHLLNESTIVVVTFILGLFRPLSQQVTSFCIPNCHPYFNTITKKGFEGSSIFF